MSLLQTLRTEHAEIIGVLDRLLASADAEERRRLFEQVAPQILAYSEAADRAFYRPMMEKGGTARTLMFYSEDEHQIISGIVRGLRRRENTASREWMRLCQMLRDAVAHHVAMQEDEVFPEAGRVFTAEELSRMNDDYLGAKRAHVDRPPAMPAGR